MTTVFVARPMAHTPFRHPETRKMMEAAGVRFVSNALEAQVIVSHNTRTLIRCRTLYPWKRFLSWTNEPRFDLNFSNEVSCLGLARVRVMNAYSGDVFWHNLHFLGSYHFDTSNALGLDLNTPLTPLTSCDLDGFKEKRTAAFFSYRGYKTTACFRDGVDIDLDQKRMQLAVAAKNRGLGTIYGKHWPRGLATENSGFGFENRSDGRYIEWWDRKIEVLKGYHFNICLENTAAPYYCTEKIWHAIVARCLPIYDSAHTKIYETFPADSFLDTARFPHREAVIDAIEAMSPDEYLERLNRCIQVYNDSLAVKREIQADSERATTGEILNHLL